MSQTKLQANITDEHRCKNPQQNTIKLNLTHIKKDHTPQSSEIYTWDATMVQYTKLINVTHHINRMKDKKNIII